MNVISRSTIKMIVLQLMTVKGGYQDHIRYQDGTNHLDKTPVTPGYPPDKYPC